MQTFKQLVFLVLDGFGVASAAEGNAIAAVAPRNFGYLVNHFLATTLQASGPAVGLPWGERGNSEVGHLNLGAGRIVSQDLPRISHAIASGEFAKNPAFLAALAHVEKNRSRLHLAGLVSPGGVHSSEEHLYSLLGLCADRKFKEVYVHMFTDGRDTEQKAAMPSIDRLERKFIQLGAGKIATVAGRFYAMDRGLHWELTESAYRAMALGEGSAAPSAREAVAQNYSRQVYDETIPPTVITENGKPVAMIKDGDAVIFFNFRPDRQVQLVRSLTDPAFDKFRQARPYLQNMYYVTMTLYDENLAASAAFPPLLIKMGLSEVVSKNGMNQFHIAESEKYAHVTSFWNGGRQEPFPGEEREIITSPQAYQKRYEDVPAMSVGKIGDAVIAKLQAGTQFILANIANPDMVGHTGNFKACKSAVEAVDEQIGRIFEEAAAARACLVISADHGNIEQTFDQRTGKVDKEHTLNPVPFVVAGQGLSRKKILQRGYEELPGIVPEGVLADAAPTVLELLGLPVTPQMTGVSLLPLLLKQTE